MALLLLWAAVAGCTSPPPAPPHSGSGGPPDEAWRVLRLGEDGALPMVQEEALRTAVRRLHARGPVAARLHVRSGRGEAGLERVSDVLASEGIVSLQAQPDGSGPDPSDIVVELRLDPAVPRACRRENESVAFERLGDSALAFGCANRRNLWSMVESPGDLDRPHSLGPAVSSHAAAAIHRYEQGPSEPLRTERLP